MTNIEQKALELLVEAVKDILNEDSLHEAEEFSDALRAALAKRGLEIREKSE